MKCEHCQHDSHTGHMCGQYNTVTYYDNVGMGMRKPSGKTTTLIDSVCQCITVGLL